jgi:hypothetical protein
VLSEEVVVCLLKDYFIVFLQVNSLYNVWSYGKVILIAEYRWTLEEVVMACLNLLSEHLLGE